MTRLSPNRTGVSLAWRIGAAVLVGGLTFFITNLSKQPLISTIQFSVFVTGVVLVVEFLLEQAAHVERLERLIDDRFRKINEATELIAAVEASAVQTDVVTQLVRHSTQIGQNMHALIRNVAHAEVSRLSEFLRGLGQPGPVSYEGEDRDWLLALASNAQVSIDATSLTAVDASGRGFTDSGLWQSDLGRRYLDIQRTAIRRRGVKIRRVFLILDQLDLISDPGFQQMCAYQRDLGFHVRVLPTSRPEVSATSLFDFIIFDNAITYEVRSAARVDDGRQPGPVTTLLYQDEDRVADRVQRFTELWEAAREIQPAKN